MALMVIWRGGLTIEHRIRDQPTRINSLIPQSTQRLTIPTIQIRRRHMIPLQLTRVVALHVSPMILIKVRQLIVHKHGRGKVGRDVEFDSTLVLARRRLVREIRELPLRRRDGCALVRRLEVVVVVLERGEADGGSCGVAVGVVECYLRYLVGAPDEEAADGGEDDADEEEGGEDGLGRENGLPGLQSLLSERSICTFLLGITGK